MLAETFSGDVDVTLGSAIASGASAKAVHAQSNNGSVSVVVTGTIEASGFYTYGAYGVFAVSSARTEIEVNDMLVSNTVSRAIVAAGGDVEITLNGAIRSDAYAIYNNFYTIRAVTLPQLSPGSSGTISIANHGTLELTGNKMGGIYARAQSDIVISGSGSVITRGNYSDAIDARSASGNISISQGTIMTAGVGSRGLDLKSESAGGGSVSATFETIVGAGQYSWGIDALATGSILITGSELAMTGEYATGIRALGFSGVDIDLLTLTTTGNISRGIFARAFAPEAAIHIALADGSTTGEQANLVTATSQSGSIAVESSGLLSVSGAGSTVVDAKAAGPVSIAVHDLNVSGDGSRGILAYSGQDASVTISGAVTGSANQVPGDPVVIGPGGIVADPALAIIDVRAVGVASVANQGTIATSGSSEGGIAIRGYSGAIISGTGSVSTTGAGATAVYAGANTVGASIVQGEAHTTGQGARAVLARSYGAVSVDIGTASTTGDDSTAIRAEGATGVLVTADRHHRRRPFERDHRFLLRDERRPRRIGHDDGRELDRHRRLQLWRGRRRVFVTGDVNVADASGVIASRRQGAASVSVAEGASVSAGRNGIFFLSGDGSRSTMPARSPAPTRP